MQTWKVPSYVVILEGGCDIYSYFPKKLGVTTNTFPTVQANFRPFALIQSTCADLQRGLEGSPSSFAHLIQVLLFVKLNKLIVFTEALL